MKRLITHQHTASPESELKQPTVLPDNWMQESITPSPNFARYGYQGWLDKKGKFFNASGIFGQSIVVAPELNLVIAKHANTPEAVGDSTYRRHTRALDAALMDYFDKQ